MLEPLRHFTLVAEHGTFTAAARRAHLSQPALSASIQRLESDLGARLFARGRSGAALTAAGEALLPRARAALAAVDDGRRAVAEVMGLAAGSVRLGAGATVCTYYLPPTLARFRAEHPGVQLLLREADQASLLDSLERGDLDVVVLARIPGGPRDELSSTKRAGLVREKWLDDELVLVGAPGIDPTTAPMVTFAPGATTRVVVDRRFSHVPIAMELGSIAAVKANTRAGVGVALVSRASIQRELDAGQLAIIASDRTPVVRPLYLVHRGKDRLPPAAGALTSMLRRRR